MLFHPAHQKKYFIDQKHNPFHGTKALSAGKMWNRDISCKIANQSVFLLTTGIIKT